MYTGLLATLLRGCCRLRVEPISGRSCVKVIHQIFAVSLLLFCRVRSFLSSLCLLVCSVTDVARVVQIICLSIRCKFCALMGSRRHHWRTFYVRAKLAYCSPAWSGYCSAADPGRLDAFLRKCKCLITTGILWAERTYNQWTDRRCWWHICCSYTS